MRARLRIITWGIALTVIYALLAAWLFHMVEQP